MSSYNAAPDAPVDTRFTAFLQSVGLKNIYSQHGEDAIIEAIFARIGTANRYCFECGAADGLFFSNTRRLIEQGWRALLVECDTSDYRKLCARFGDSETVRVHQAMLTADPREVYELTLDDVLAFHDAPGDLDLLVLDVDSSEYYLLNSMVRHQPRVVIVEYDPDAEEMFIPELRGKGQAGHLAMRYVAEARGYDVIGRTPTNLICVRRDLSHLLMDGARQMRRFGLEIKTTAEWERETNEFLREARGVIHVGANEGQERALYAEMGLPVIWIEALSDVFRKLQANIAAYPDQQAFKALLTDEDGGRREFNIAGGDGQASSIFQPKVAMQLWARAAPLGAATYRETTTLAALVEREGIDIARYDALVLDVQGAEALVLKGAGDLLKGFRWIRCEAADCELYEGGCQLSDLDAMLLPLGFVREKTWQAMGQSDVGYVYEALYRQPDVKPAPKSLYQVFAAGRWQDYHDGATIEVATVEEREAANAGQLQVRRVTSERRRVQIALAMSTPRIGYLDCLEQIIDLAYAAGLSRFRGGGVFWHHGLSRSIQHAVDWRDPQTGEGFDYILTADYDSFATPAQLQQIAQLLSHHPEIDALVPLQVKRGEFLEVLAGSEGAINLTMELVPIGQGHFGFTLFRRQFFERLPKPWFWEEPDEDGNWGEGRTDSDIGFWKNAKECGLKVFLAPRIVIGHGDECVVFPRIVDGRVEKVYIHVNEWNATKTPPPGIGVIPAIEVAANA